MPIYEFYSPDTHKIYTFYARSLQESSMIPLCPNGKNFKMEKLFSGFSVTGLADKRESNEHSFEEKNTDDPFANMSEKQASHVMKEMEKNFGSIDDENPDPRQMGKMMRKMCEITGEKMDGVMEEVVRKLEEGACPEELEEKIGEQMDDVGNEHTDEDGNENSSKKIISKSSPIQRDPVLYEMQDYLPKS